MMIRRLLRSTGGAGAAEFALVLPLLVLLLFGIIDAGRWMFLYNQAEKATQVGARMAVVTNVLSAGLIAEDYGGQTIAGETLKPGDLIPAEALGVVKCNSDGCSCEASPCPSSLGTMDTAAFAAIVARMNMIAPSVTANKVEVRYSGSGLGSAGSIPTGTGGGGSTAEAIEISPLVTVSLRNLKFEPISLLLAAAVNMPDFRTTLTAEDVSGVYSE